jgi:hypothetical protein
MSGLERCLGGLAESNEVAESLLANQRAVHDQLDRQYYRWVSDECNWFTDHGEQHIKSVLHQASNLLRGHLEKDDAGYLNEMELYLLISSILWHDVAMVRSRADHAEEVTEVIEEMKMTFQNPGIRRSVERIAKAHSGEDGLSLARTKASVTADHRSYTVNERALAAVLRFADEISENQSRVSHSELVLDEVPEESLIYWRFAQSIPGIRIDLERERVVVSIELDIKEAVERYPCPSEYRHRARDGELPLIKYVVCRLEKMNNEKAYCAPEFRKYVDIREIEARFALLDEDNGDHREVTEVIGDAGLKKSSSYPEISIFEEFFDHHAELVPENILGEH